MNKAFSVVAALLGILLSIYAIIEISSDPGQGIVKAVRAVALVFLPVAFAKPRIGLYGVFFALANIEWLKRYAIFYGDVSIWSVASTLVLPLALFSAVILGTLMGSFVGATKMTLLRFFWFAFAAVVILGIIGIKGTSPHSIQVALNSGLYIAIIPVVLMLFKDQQDLMKLFNVCAVIFSPWAVVAIYQYFNGYSDVDWYYARTGISPVFSKTMLSEAGSRPYGLAGSSPSFGAISFLAWYMLWKAIYVKDKRMLAWGLAGLFLFSLFISGYRTASVSPVITLIGYRLFKSRNGLILAYSSGMGAAILMVVFSQHLLDNLKTYDTALKGLNSSSEWWQKTVSVSTWSDRLRGYNRLKDPEAWSFFGKEIEGGYKTSTGQLNVKSRDYSHDLINVALKNIGAVGLVLVSAVLFIALIKLHGLVLKLPPGPAQEFATMGLSYSLLKMVLSVTGGGNFNVAPTATFTWLFFAAVVMAGREVPLLKKKGSDQEQESEVSADEVISITPSRLQNPSLG